jgi:hypothetical protein
MEIDRKVEQATRTMLGHAMRHELDALAGAIRSAWNDTFPGAIPLCLLASAYIAIEASGMRWPDDIALRKIAENAAKSATGLNITDEEIFRYLSRVALGSEKLGDVFADEGLATMPLYATANLLLTFCPRDKDWWEYLDQIWDAAEAAESTRLTVLPALMLRAHKESAARNNDSAHAVQPEGRGGSRGDDPFAVTTQTRTLWRLPGLPVGGSRSGS